MSPPLCLVCGQHPVCLARGGVTARVVDGRRWRHTCSSACLAIWKHRYNLELKKRRVKSPREVDANRRASRELRRRRKDLGLCPTCGGERQRFVTCTTCRVRRQARRANASRILPKVSDRQEQWHLPSLLTPGAAPSGQAPQQPRDPQALQDSALGCLQGTEASREPLLRGLSGAGGSGTVDGPRP